MDAWSPCKIVRCSSKSWDRHWTYSCINDSCQTSITSYECFSVSQLVTFSDSNRICRDWRTINVRQVPGDNNIVSIDCSRRSWWLFGNLSSKDRYFAWKITVSDWVSCFNFKGISVAFNKCDACRVCLDSNSVVKLDPCARRLVIENTVIDYRSSTIRRAISPCETDLRCWSIVRVNHNINRWVRN